MVKVSFSENELIYLDYVLVDPLKSQIINLETLLFETTKVPFSIKDYSIPYYPIIDLEQFNFLEFFENCIEIQNYFNSFK